MNIYEDIFIETYSEVLLNRLVEETERADRNYEVAKFFEQQYFILLVESGKISANQARIELGLPSLQEVMDGR